MKKRHNILKSEVDFNPEQKKDFSYVLAAAGMIVFILFTIGYVIAVKFFS